MKSLFGSDAMSSAVKDWLIIIAVLLGLAGFVLTLYLWVDRTPDPVFNDSESVSKEAIILAFLSEEERLELERCKNKMLNDLDRLGSSIRKVEESSGIDKVVILELAKLCVKGERLAKLFKSKEFCLFCMVKHADHSHWDKDGYLVNDEFAAKNNPDLLFKDPDEKDQSVRHLAFFILITPKENYLPALKEKEKVLHSILKKFLH